MSSLEHGNKGKKRPALKTEVACARMGHYFELLDDHMARNNRIHLPSWDSQKYVYASYKDDMVLHGYEESD